MLEEVGISLLKVRRALINVDIFFMVYQDRVTNQQICAMSVQPFIKIK